MESQGPRDKRRAANKAGNRSTSSNSTPVTSPNNQFPPTAAVESKRPKAMVSKVSMVTVERKVIARTQNARKELWAMDSRATSHVCNNGMQINNYVAAPESIEIKVANGASLWVYGRGKVAVIFRNNPRRNIMIDFHEVLYATGSTHNLYSICRLFQISPGNRLIFNDSSAYIYSRELYVGQTDLQNGLYWL